MRVADACACINKLATVPGFTVEACSHEHRYEDTLKLTVTALDWPNSDRDQAPGYPEKVNPNGPYAHFPVYVGDVTNKAELIGRVLDTLIRVFEHEAREFTRYHDGDEWVAPFHPHRKCGIDAWCERTGHEPTRDTTYGLA